MESTTTYTTTETHEAKKPSASPAIIALASVGFITLIVLGILLAIYSARYVPEAIEKIFSSWVDTSENPPQLGVVSTTTISFGQEPAVITAPLVPATPVATTTKPVPAKPVTTTPTKPVSTTPALHGLSNLSVTILATGYLANGTTESFVPSSIIPAGARAAVRFSIANNGTNVTGPWSFAAAIPTRNVYVFSSPIQQSLKPGDHIVYTLGFDQANWGPNQPLTIIADPANIVNELNQNDNTATAVISVQ